MWSVDDDALNCVCACVCECVRIYANEGEDNEEKIRCNVHEHSQTNEACIVTVEYVVVNDARNDQN